MAADAFIERAKTRVQRTSDMWLKGLVQSVRYGRGGIPAGCHVFVAGVQRSGTNMMMDLFDRSFETDAYHETDPRAFKDYDLRETEVLKSLASHSSAPFFVVKTLSNLDRLPALMEDFQPGRVVWIVRRYTDVINSMLASFKSVPSSVQRAAREGPAAGWVGRGMSDDTHALLQQHVGRGLNDYSLAGLMWYLRNILYFEQRLDRHPAVVTVRYEDLVTQPEEQCRRVFDFVGLRFHPRIVRRVHAVSIGRRPAPPLDPQVAALCESLWKRFDEALCESGAPAASTSISAVT